MSSVYLIVYADALGTREQVKNCIHNLPSVIMWRYDLPNSFYVVSDYDANTIALQIRDRINKTGHFIVTKILPAITDTQGFLPTAAWHLIHKKELLPEGGK